MTDQRPCTSCGKSKTKQNFSNSQWKNQQRRTCFQCQGLLTPQAAETSLSSVQVQAQPTTIKMIGLPVVEYEALNAKCDALVQENLRLTAENHQLLLQYTDQSHRIVRVEKENLDFKQQIEALKAENLQLQLENAQLRKDVQSLQAKSQIQEAKLIAYDLARLFVYYYVNPTEPWSSLSNELANKKAMLEDSEITKKEFEAWLSKQPQSKCLVELQNLMSSRHEVAHTDVRSTLKQQEFLTKVKAWNWTSTLPDFQELIRFMIEKLGKTQLKRIN